MFEPGWEEKAKAEAASKRDLRRAIQILESIRDLDLSEIDMCNGSPSDDNPCCLGAHFARKLELQSSPDSLPITHWDGVFAFADLIGVTFTAVKKLFQDSGAGKHPFTCSPWEAPVSEVCKNVIQTLKKWEENTNAKTSN